MDLQLIGGYECSPMTSERTQARPVIVITGASRGIGLGVACLLAAYQTSMFLTARGASELHRVTAFLKRQGAEVDHHACDVADEVAMTHALGMAAQMGPIEGMLNNAGVLEPIGPIDKIEIAAFEAHMRTNVTGVLVGIRQALAHRAPGHPLRVVNVSSGAATHGYRSWGAYCGSKAAVNLLTEVASAESDASTSVVAVAPGIIETRMQRTIRDTPPSQFPDVAKFQDLKDRGALLHPIDAANALVWLLCEAPLSLSGRFVDARDEEMLRNVPRADESAVRRAKGWFEALET
jgi:NAD(P)-dependent dehydrogenase (short-subunit alcohol dehydrogenase family)